MLYVSSLLWKPNSHSYAFSSYYDESWVDKLYRGFKRNLSVPFEFVLFTDRKRKFEEPVTQELLERHPITYGSCIEPYKLDKPMILVGLDTLIIRNIDHFAKYCLTKKRVAVPIDPYHKERVCNGVALVPAGNRSIYDAWDGRNDMEMIRQASNIDHLDDLFPGEVLSYKVHIRGKGVPRSCRIVYFHGKPKMNNVGDDVVWDNWK